MAVVCPCIGPFVSVQWDFRYVLHIVTIIDTVLQSSSWPRGSEVKMSSQVMFLELSPQGSHVLVFVWPITNRLYMLQALKDLT